MGRSKLQNFNDQGEEVYFNPKKHHFDDVLRKEALEWLRGRDDALEPFLAVLSTHAPHSPATPARRHADLFPGSDLPRPESFNEKQVDDKNGWIKRLEPLERGEIDEMETLEHRQGDRMVIPNARTVSGPWKDGVVVAPHEDRREEHENRRGLGDLAGAPHVAARVRLTRPPLRRK
jgi:hypothetical protein